MFGLAKRLEEVWLPGTRRPGDPAAQSEGLYLLQRVRDEAHRFAITYHRQRRSKAMTASALDDVPGLGATRRKAAAQALRLGQAAARGRPSRRSPRCPASAPRTAAAIDERCTSARARAPTAPVAVNTATGEILDAMTSIPQRAAHEPVDGTTDA